VARPRYSLDEMYDDLRRRASRTAAQSLLQGLGELAGPVRKRGRRLRPRTKSPELGLAEAWRATLDVFNQTLRG
jgi:hypothetical protein